MPRSETWCWVHMKDHCNHCELVQLQKIVKDAINYSEAQVCEGTELDGLLDILKRTIRPSQVMFEEDEDGVFHQQ
jgi:hypothetical protein